MFMFFQAWFWLQYLWNGLITHSKTKCEILHIQPSKKPKNDVTKIV